MRAPSWLRRAVGGRREREPKAPGLLDVARALLTDDDEHAERVADALARQRRVAERETAARAEVDAATQRRDATTRWIEAECKRQGYWWPSDYH